MQFRHILIPIDFSRAAEPAVHQALALAAREQARVLLLHVLPGEAVSGTEGRAQATAEEWLQDLARQAAGPVETCVVWGHAATEICRVAAERQIDLIVIHPHGRPGRPLHFLGSVADAVIRKAPCAVLVARTSLFDAAPE
jgi:nucleotide-binding universal stress UspA family protein